MSDCMPPSEAPIESLRRWMPRWSRSRIWARTMSATVTMGKSVAQGSPVPGFIEDGPVLP